MGVDYVEVNTSTITITPGTTEVVFRYMTRCDDVVEWDEDFQLALKVDNATMDAGILAGSPDVATVTIVDDKSKLDNACTAKHAFTTTCTEGPPVYSDHSRLTLEPLNQCSCTST